MNHIDAVSKDITQLYQTIAHGFDLTQHYIMGRPMLKPTPRFLSAYHMNINLQVINLQLFAWQDTINKLQKIRDQLSLAVITTPLPPQLPQGCILHHRFCWGGFQSNSLLPVPVFALQNYSERFKEKKRISGLGGEQLHQSSFPHSSHSYIVLTSWWRETDAGGFIKINNLLTIIIMRKHHYLFENTPQ